MIYKNLFNLKDSTRKTNEKTEILEEARTFQTSEKLREQS